MKQGAHFIIYITFNYLFDFIIKDGDIVADIYDAHFEFSGISSRMFGLKIVNVNTERLISLSGKIEGKTIFHRGNQKTYLIGNDYSDFPLSFDVEIITDDERILEFDERRKIEKWLFNKHNYRKLYIDISDDPFGEMYELVDGIQKRLYLNCRFINPEKLEYNGGIVGYKATIETDTGMFWQDATIKSYITNHMTATESSIITVNVDTDLDDFIYPKVSIVMGEYGGDIIISNNSDDSSRLTKFINLSPHTSIIMKGDINYISGQNYEKFFKQNFIRLIDGENNLTVMGNVQSIEFEFSNRRMF